MLQDHVGFRQAHVVLLTRPALVGPLQRVIVSVCLRPIVRVSNSAHPREIAQRDRCVSPILAVVVVVFALLLLPMSSVVLLPPSKMVSHLLISPIVKIMPELRGSVVKIESY